MKQNYQAMARFLRPVLERRLQAWPAERKEKESGRPSDFMQWMLDASQTQPCTLERQYQLLLGNATDAAFATNISLTHISFDLATYPEYIQPLREEFGDMIERPQDITRARMASLGKLDSILKESHRINPQAVGT